MIETLTVHRDLTPYPNNLNLDPAIFGIPVRKELGPDDFAIAEVRDEAGHFLGYITEADKDEYANRPTASDVQRMLDRLNRLWKGDAAK